MEEKPTQTKYEKARMIGSRALQLSLGAPSTIKLSEKELEDIRYNPLEIAKKEFEQGKIPLKITRPLPGVQKRSTEKKER